MKKRFFVTLMLTAATLMLNAADRFISYSSGEGNFKISGTGAIIYDAADWKGVAIAAENLKTDFRKVTGDSNANIIIGTLGKSAVIDKLAKAKLIDAKLLKGKNEKFIITAIDAAAALKALGTDALSESDRKALEKAAGETGSILIVAGSDKRGTIYGTYEISEQIGVSPWYDWADVPVMNQQAIYAAKQGIFTDGEPAVKYRGIFLNDEAPALSGWIRENYNGVYNHEFYARVFELVLRLKGNFMWPAMWSSAFYADDPLNMQTADDMGVIMGTSHHEPMGKAHQEWRRMKNRGKWNFDANREQLEEFFRAGVERMKNTEDVVTIGMRGDGDEPLGDNADVALLERIVKAQRKIITDVTGKPAKETPQVWALYKEVQEYYEKGMTAPDDVILLLCDDNWGNVRILPELEADKKGGKNKDVAKSPWAKRHPGGYGMYYHVDYVGAPRNSKWLNVSQVQRIWEQMKLTYEYGVDKLWILNVGDLKPMELPIDFWFRMAWNPKAFDKTANGGEGITLNEYLEKYCAQQFGEKNAKEAARILDLNCKYTHRRTAEQMDKNAYNLKNGEWAARLAEFKALEADALAQYITLPAQYRDAYDQIILFPVRAMANIYDMYYAYAMNDALAKEGDPEANVWADRAYECYVKDSLLCADYNHNIAGGKWNHMMDEIHIGYKSWNGPNKRFFPEVKRVQEGTAPLCTEKNGKIVIEACQFVAKKDAPKASWTVIPNYGIYKNAVALMPYNESAKGAELTYSFRTKSTEARKAKLTFCLAPTFPFNSGRGHKLAYSIDGGAQAELNTNGVGFIKFQNATGDQQYDWAKYRVNKRVVEIEIPASSNGEHTLTVAPLDPAIVIEQIVIE